MKFEVTHRESKEVTVVVEAKSREEAENAVEEAASANWFEANRVGVEHEVETLATPLKDPSSLPLFVVDDEGLLRIPNPPGFPLKPLPKGFRDG